VLIVDASSESREVLRLLLERRGARTIEAQGPAEGARLASHMRPDLIVLDAESDRSDSGTPTHELQRVAGRSDTPIVILGKVRQNELFPADQIVSKPYHYGQLIRKIDSLLDAA
jgi:CheY-like chemotaxis protein